MKLDDSLAKTILITGGAGFIGSNFIKYFLAHNSKYNVVNLDKLTYAGNLENLYEISNNKRYNYTGSISPMFQKRDMKNQGSIISLQMRCLEV